MCEAVAHVKNGLNQGQEPAIQKDLSGGRRANKKESEGQPRENTGGGKGRKKSAGGERVRERRYWKSRWVLPPCIWR